MLSIIISTINADNFDRVKKNIEQTVGVPYEIVEIQNNRKFGLSEAYNTGAQKAVFQYLCFIHEDVLFHTHNWGKQLLQYLDDKETGLVGVAGGIYKSEYGLDWKDGNETFYRALIIDGILDGERFYFNPMNEKKSRVICLDGLFLTCRKQVWMENKLDEEIFKGFHFYDADWSMQVNLTLKNYVVYDIEVEHFSHGSINREFLENSFLFEEKWKDHLPVHLNRIENKELASIEGYQLSRKLKIMKLNGYSIKERFRLVKKYYSRYKDYYQLTRNIFYGFIRTKKD